MTVGGALALCDWCSEGFRLIMDIQVKGVRREVGDKGFGGKIWGGMCNDYHIIPAKAT